MNTKLSQCPFCGSGNVDTEVVAPHTHKVATFMPDYHGGAMACCYDCSAAIWRDGPDALGNVIDLWNKRPDLTRAAPSMYTALCDLVSWVGALAKDQGKHREVLNSRRMGLALNALSDARGELDRENGE